MKIWFVVLHRGKSKVVASVEDRAGHRRLVEYKWLGKGKEDIPPEQWADQVSKEAELQLAAEEDKAKGRHLF